MEETPKKPKRTLKVKADLRSKPGKYYLARQSGKSKHEAAAIAGYSMVDPNVYQIEQTKTYQAIEKKYYKDVLLEKITLAQIADEQVKVILQDAELGAKNQAIKMALEKVEPESRPDDSEDKVMIILKG